MEDEKFREIAESGVAQLRTVFTAPHIGLELPGELMSYNAYLDGREVVCLGYQYPTPGGPEGSTMTKCLAILIDDQLFADIRVDDEGPRPEST